ncbi:MAG: hypothetical protein Q9182_003064 [Xanthomendoza sp. 2 TL-2023]
MAFTTASESAPSPPISRPFLSLPDVIRERIYDFVLTVDVDSSAPWVTPLPLSRHLKLPSLPSEPNRDLAMVSKSVRKKRRRIIRAYEQVEKERDDIVRAAPHSCLAILATCRTVLLEAFHLWYKNNTFSFSRAQDLIDFNRSIGRVRAHEIRSVRLNLPIQEEDDLKAGQVLDHLLRLEKVTFVCNEIFINYVNPNFISFPKVISRLQGLREVDFVFPLNPAVEHGVRHNIGTCHRVRMDQLREKMMSKRKHPRPLPPMIDLFGPLKMANQNKEDRANRKWKEHSAYAPDVHDNSQIMSNPEE